MNAADTGVDLYRAVVALDNKLAGIDKIVWLILAIQVAAFLLSLLKLLMMDRLRAAMRANARNSSDLVDLICHTRQLDRMEGTEARKIVLSAAEKAEMAARAAVQTVAAVVPSSDSGEVPVAAPPDLKRQANLERIARYEKRKELGDAPTRPDH